MKITRCDRCGAEKQRTLIDTPWPQIELHNTVMFGPGQLRVYDICHGCLEEFRGWIKGAKS